MSDLNSEVRVIQTSKSLKVVQFKSLGMVFYCIPTMAEPLAVSTQYTNVIDT